MWQRRLRIGPAEPRALGVKRFRRRRRSRHRFLDAQRLRLELVVVLRVGDGRLERLGHKPRRLARHDRQHRLRLQRGQALNLPHHLAHLLRGHRHVFRDGVDLHNTISPPPWPCARRVFLNVRVRENSPSRWPTMFSVTKTGLKTLPLCTLNVRPTKSGVIIERRDHVLIGVFGFVLLRLLDFLQQVTVNERTFFNRASHNCLLVLHRHGHRAAPR